jgi:DNA repair protein RecO (recombination protein O)
MPLERGRCVCVRKHEYSETSQILTLFSREYGLLRLIAKGAHRRTKAGASKFDGGVDLLDLGEAVFSHAPEKQLPPLTEWHLLEGHLELRRNLRAVLLGQYAAELITVLFEEHDPHPELFERLENTLIELGTPRLEEAFLSLELDLLREGGYLPQFAACVDCGSVVRDRERVYFSPPRGGLICRNCEAAHPERIEVDIRLIRLVQTILRLPRTGGTLQRLPRLTRHQTDPINRLLWRHIEHALARRLRLPRYVLGQATGKSHTTSGISRSS